MALLLDEEKFLLPDRKLCKPFPFHWIHAAQFIEGEAQRRCGVIIEAKQLERLLHVLNRFARRYDAQLPRWGVDHHALDPVRSQEFRDQWPTVQLSRLEGRLLGKERFSTF